MSRNFEILQRLGKEDFFVPAGLPVSSPKVTPSPVRVRGQADDEITRLIQSLFFRGGQSVGPRVVSFSGVESDDRSGWICARAGEALASQVNASVCLVDANFRSPQLHTHFGVANRTGLADALNVEGSIRSFTTPLSGGHLWLLPSGSATGDLCAGVDRFRARFTELREKFDYIIISGPSLAREAEATLMGQLADGLVLIVEANQTRREAVRRAQERLKTSKVELLGAVLDQRTFPIPEYLYRKL
jgi:Mrp family chromosome partitioning ATPase